eukprot:COSAG06_NODE_4145_length_4526_cov_13.643099_1_plen_71_part_00
MAFIAGSGCRCAGDGWGAEAVVAAASAHRSIALLFGRPITEHPSSLEALSQSVCGLVWQPDHPAGQLSCK